MSRLPSLDIVIVNWNTGGALRACLESIAAGRRGITLTRVVVVDNASTDDSLPLASTVSLPMTMVANDANRGFGAACNQGAAGSNADYLLFLNPDTRLDPDTLERTLTFLEQASRQDVGICGIRLLDDDGNPSTTAARFPSPRIFLGEATGLARLVPWLLPRHLLTPRECSSTRDVDQVIGAYFMIRRSLFEALRGFDERFFVYFEEVDLSLRARRSGYRSVFFDGATAYHQGGLSSGQVKAARLFYALRGRMLYAWKHFSLVSRWAVLLITVLVEWPTRTVRARLHGGSAPSDTALAFRRLCGFLASPGWRHSLDLQRRP